MHFTKYFVFNLIGKMLSIVLIYWGSTFAQLDTLAWSKSKDRILNMDNVTVKLNPM